MICFLYFFQNIQNTKAIPHWDYWKIKILKVFRLDLAKVDENVCLEIDELLSQSYNWAMIIVVLVEVDKDWGNPYDFFRNLYPKVSSFICVSFYIIKR